jgi:hypothetical protein
VVAGCSIAWRLDSFPFAPFSEGMAVELRATVTNEILGSFASLGKLCPFGNHANYFVKHTIGILI